MMETIIIVIFYMIIIYISYTIYSLFTTPFLGYFIEEKVSSNIGSLHDISNRRRFRIYTQSKSIFSDKTGVIIGREFFNTLLNYFGLLARKDIPTIIHTILYFIVLFYTIDFISSFITNGYLLFIIGFFLITYMKIFSINYYNFRVAEKIISDMLTGNKYKSGFI